MIEINELTKYYGKGESRFKALDGVSVRINDGEFIVILGASGSGKSTFLNVISGLEPSDGGCVAYDSQELGNMSEKDLTKFRRENTAYIPLMYKQPCLLFFLFSHIPIYQLLSNSLFATDKEEQGSGVYWDNFSLGLIPFEPQGYQNPTLRLYQKSSTHLL